MKRLKTLTLIAALSALAACSGSIGSVEPPILADPPEDLTRSCERPVLLPDRDLTQREVEMFWINDRENLIRCGLRLQELIEFYNNRDKGITDE